MMKFHIIALAFMGCLLVLSCDSNPKTTNDIEKISDVVEEIDSTLTKKEDSVKTEKEEEPIIKDDAPEPPRSNAPPHSSSSVHGIDISQFQGDEIDFLNKQKDNLSFIICKATEGITFTDPEFNNNWRTIPEKGFIRGAYHFYRSADNPRDQADNYLRAIADLKDTDLPPLIDFEGGGIDKSQSVEFIQKNLIAFLNRVESKSGRTPLIYTDIPTGNKYLDKPKFAEYALWIALYVDEDQPQLPIAWRGKRWVFWQKSSSYTIDNRRNDFDIFNGNYENLLSFIKNY